METVKEYSLYIISALVILVVILLVVIFTMMGETEESFQYPGILTADETKNVTYNPVFEQMTQYDKNQFEGFLDEYGEQPVEDPRLLDILYG